MRKNTSVKMVNTRSVKEHKTKESKTFGTVSAITTEAKQYEEQVKRGVTANNEKIVSLELGNLMAKLEQIDKKLKCSGENRQ